MKQFSPHLALSMPLAALFAFLGIRSVQDPVPAAAGNAPQTMTVGVVDFVQVFEAYPKFTKARQDIDDLGKKNQELMDKEAAQLDELEIRIKGLDPESRDRAELELQYRVLSDRLKGLRGLFEVDMQREYAKSVVSTYEDVERAIRQVAQEKGIQLVLRQRKDVGARTLSDQMQAFQQRNVWYAAEELDLTPAIIKLLKVLDK